VSLYRSIALPAVPRRRRTKKPINTVPYGGKKRSGGATPTDEAGSNESETKHEETVNTLTTSLFTERDDQEEEVKAMMALAEAYS
jgi:hypothetical protein